MGTNSGSRSEPPEEALRVETIGSGWPSISKSRSQGAAIRRSKPGFSSLTSHEQAPTRNFAEFATFSAVMPAPTKGKSARPRPKTGNTIGSSRSTKSDSQRSSICVSGPSTSDRGTRSVEKASFSGVFAKSVSSGKSDNSGSFSSAASFLSSPSSSVAAASFLAVSPLSSSSQTAVSPASNRSSNCFRRGDSSNRSTMAGVNRAPQIGNGFRSASGY